MWIFLPKYGFFSAVCARTGGGGQNNPIDPDRINLRARERQHLELLVKDFDELSGAEIIETPHADYACRIICAKPAWAAVLSRIALAMDYDNFKSECHREEQRTGKEFNSILPRVWELTRKMQGD